MNAELVESIAGLRERLARIRRSGAKVGLVPTMGALHAGHARLVERARGDCQSVTVSIFVNPLQFDREDDLRRYPRTLEGDRELCGTLGVDFVFAPPVEEMYPIPPACRVDVGRLADHLCGPYRPGHFPGVATIVLKLFEIVGPDRAYFGEKDAQQLAIIRRLVSDFNVPVQVVGVPTVREPDGLAMSSRNRQLGPSERELATVLYRALREADRQISTGTKDVHFVKAKATAEIPRDASLRLEYLDIVDPDDVQPVARIAGPVLVAGALWVGSTRLIDNLLSTPPPEKMGS
ncbi:MAG: pantoate--beta-alanine ligase [Acidobacteria bacterium RIFCSPLOWO2_02_FULL_64_15]|nr:MAG: pantoate--beta-alanine ligase [Acidobacteria bacterium RIFCSPLOWO2_02_FULL_64_15]